jgi:hypothetical protein
MRSERVWMFVAALLGAVVVAQNIANWHALGTLHARPAPAPIIIEAREAAPAPSPEQPLVPVLQHQALRLRAEDAERERDRLSRQVMELLLQNTLRAIAESRPSETLDAAPEFAAREPRISMERTLPQPRPPRPGYLDAARTAAALWPSDALPLNLLRELEGIDLGALGERMQIMLEDEGGGYGDLASLGPDMQQRLQNAGDMILGSLGSRLAGSGLGIGSSGDFLGELLDFDPDREPEMRRRAITLLGLAALSLLDPEREQAQKRLAGL